MQSYGHQRSSLLRFGFAATLAAALLVTCLVLVPAPKATAQDNEEDVTLTLLHNNDGESKLLPNVERGYPGVARFTRKLQDLGTASEADILLRVSAGDNFLASKEFATSLALSDSDRMYDAVALDGLYEAMALGNHDFDFGPEVTARFIDDFTSPFLAANIDTSTEPALNALSAAGRIAPSTVITDRRSNEKIGVIGAITPRLANISSPGQMKVSPQVAEAVNAQVKALTERGINKIVLVSHLQGLSEDRELIPQLEGVDIVVAGGGDELLKNPGDTCLAQEPAFDSYPIKVADASGKEVLVVTAPGGYRCIGHLEVTFDKDGNIKDYSGTSHTVELDGPVEDYVLNNVEKPLAEALAELNSQVVATSDIKLDGRRNSVRTSSTNLGELLADAVLKAGDNAGIAIQNGGGIRNDSELAAGEITVADTFDVAPFSNFVTTGDVERKVLKDLLETAVATLPDPSGTYPQISGFTMNLDTAKPARQVDADNNCALGSEPGSRVRDVVLDDGTEIIRDGQVVDGPAVRLATIDFLAGGGDCYPLKDIDFVRSNTSYQQALAKHLQTTLGGKVTAEMYPEGGSRVTFAGGKPQPSSETDTQTEAAKKAEAQKKAEQEALAKAEAEKAAKEQAAKEQAAKEQAEGTGGGDSEKPLPTTGANSALAAITALTVAAAGLMISRHSRRVGEISVGNRFNATGAWFPEDND